jgi:hypothetical protein
MRERDHQILREILETRGDFGHREHLQLAWSYPRVYPIEAAAQAMVDAIRYLARQHRDARSCSSTSIRLS